MKYAVIQLAGKQYKVSPGEKLTVNSLETAEGEEIKTSDVLLIADDGKVQVGTPLVKNAVVTLKVVSHQKGDKLRVATYHAKSRYRRVRGHRQHETTVEVVSLS
jgi:large subunit ribosomal protein L21